MGTTINGQDLNGIAITPPAEKGGAYRVAARCPVCGDLVILYLTPYEVEMKEQVEKACHSGQGKIHSFQLYARYNPDAEDESGVDVWGVLEMVESDE